MITDEQLEERLNHPQKEARLEALEALMTRLRAGAITAPDGGDDVNNHIHTFYSFSPYSPTAAVWRARMAGLSTAGIMDHDSVAGIWEFHQAGNIAGMAVTGGMECRVSLKGTALADRRINNPDQAGVAYMAFHGIPVASLNLVEAFIAPRRIKRNERNHAMCEKINGIYGPFHVCLDFDRDVLPVSKAAEGGSVTERHILWALSLKLAEKYDRGRPIVDLLRDKIGLAVGAKAAERLTDESNPYYLYDLLGVLKSDVSAFYIDAAEECPAAAEAVALCRKAGAISAYAYLGDVGDSVTGDKRAQRFEDGYLDLLFDILKKIGFNAVTYMPSRNTHAQLLRIKALCAQYGLMEISGEDINSPRQSFVCLEARAPEYANLRDTTWALIGHEQQTAKDPALGLFAAGTMAAQPDLNKRIRDFKQLAGR